MYTNVSAQDRLWPFCTCINGVVDDIHILLKCDTYNDLRDYYAMIEAEGEVRRL